MAAICAKAQPQADRLPTKLKDGVQVRRLKEHLALRERALEFTPDAAPPLSSYPEKEVHEDVDALLKSGVVLPICTKMAIFKYHATPIWDKACTDSEVIDEQQRKACIKQLLHMHALFTDGPPVDFNHRSPRLVDMGLTDQSLAEAVLHEFWSTKMCAMISACSASGGLAALCEMLLQEWVLTMDVGIGEASAQMFLDSKRVAQVLLQLLGGAIMANTSSEVFADAATIEEASFITEGTASLFTTVGQSINESASLKGVLQTLPKSSKTMIARAPALAKQMAALATMTKEPSKALCVHLKEMFDDLPSVSATLVAGATDEYEAMALKFATDTANTLLDAIEKGDTTSLADSDFGAMLNDYRDLFKMILAAIPTDDILRRVSTRISTALSSNKAADQINKIINSIDNFIATKKPSPEELTEMLRPIAQHGMTIVGVLKLEALATHLCAHLAPPRLPDRPGPRRGEVVELVPHVLARRLAEQVQDHR